MDKIGTILDETAKKDALHVAVAPLVASRNLIPGERIGVEKDGVTAVRSSFPVGIVDPFLKDPVIKGERFYMFLYPNTVTSLRHDWEHPAFSAARPSASEERLRNFADTLPISYKALMDGAATWVEYDDYLCCGGLLEGEYVPDEFWEHYENVTGTVVPEDRKRSFFTCSC